uniref:Transmembrane protein 182 n=1 Tax=Sander lucioperca TaxID=283035 RepID=A0A8C9Y877_SANLU
MLVQTLFCRLYICTVNYIYLLISHHSFLCAFFQRGDVLLQESTSDITLYHEGFFWRCSFGGSVGDDNLMWKLWFTNQPQSKVCMHAYLFPFPVSHQTHNATEYDSAIIYRGFWSIFMLIGVAAVVLGGFFIICAAPFASHRLYKAGGGLFLASGEVSKWLIREF